MTKILKRLKTGLKKGFNTKTLPPEILDLQNRPLIRGFRFVSGICLLLVITKTLRFLGDGDLYLFGLTFCLFFMLLYLIFQCYLTIHRIKFMRKILKDKELEIRNSPFFYYLYNLLEAKRPEPFNNNLDDIKHSRDLLEENNINTDLILDPNLDFLKESSPMFYSLNDQLSNLELLIRDFLIIEFVII